MFGDHAAYIIPSYLVTALVMLGLLVWIKLTYAKHQKEIAALEQKGISRGSALKNE